MKSNSENVAVHLRLDGIIPQICVDGSEEDCITFLKHLKAVNQPITTTEPEMLATMIERCYKSKHGPVDLTELGILVTNNVFDETLEKLKQWDWDLKRVIIHSRQITKK
ncbi:MAG: hypothetical protein WC575_03350 [Patescibacteria group bacterium]